VDSLYNIDENKWLEQQIGLLKTGDVSALDRANLIEYLTAMAARDKRELQSRLTVLLAHVLKVKFQQTHVSRSWASTIETQQREIKLLLKHMPSLVPYVATIFDEAYEDAVKKAAAETGLPLPHFGLPKQFISYADAMGTDPLSLPIKHP
jgi:hypothetical protein